MATSPYYSGPDFRWRIVGGAVDLTFDMPGNPLWQRQWRGRRSRTLCTQREQVEIASLGPRGIQLTIQIKPSGQQDAMAAQVEQILENPNVHYTLYQPGRAPRTVTVDPEQDVSDDQNGGAIIYKFGLMEVGSENIIDGSLNTPNGGNPFVYGDPYELDVSALPLNGTLQMAVGWGNIPNPTNSDMVFLNLATDTGVNGIVANAGTFGVRQGQTVLTVVDTVPPGAYKLRLFLWRYNDAIAVIDGPDVSIV